MATKKTTTKTTTSKKTTTTKTTKDRFGSREGTESAKINAAITTKPQTVAEIAEAAKLTTTRVRNHMKWLLDRDHVAKTDNGYKAKTKAKRKTTK